MSEFLVKLEESGTEFRNGPVAEDTSGQTFSDYAGSPVSKNDGRFISVHDIRKTSISTILKTAQHGKYLGKPASLVVIDFIFLSPDRKNRFKRASINISFESRASPTPPHILQHCPNHVMGDDSSATRARTTSAAVTIGTPGSLAFGSVAREQADEKQMITRFEMKSVPKGDPRTGKINSVTWHLSENGSHQGVPHRNTVALLLQNQGGFVARIGFTAELSPTFHPLSWVGARSTKTLRVPLLLDESVGPPMQNLDVMESMKIEELVKLPERV